MDLSTVMTAVADWEVEAALASRKEAVGTLAASLFASSTLPATSVSSSGGGGGGAGGGRSSSCSTGGGGGANLNSDSDTVFGPCWSAVADV